MKVSDKGEARINHSCPMSDYVPPLPILLAKVENCSERVKSEETRMNGNAKLL